MWSIHIIMIQKGPWASKLYKFWTHNLLALVLKWEYLIFGEDLCEEEEEDKAYATSHTLRNASDFFHQFGAF